MSDTTSQEEQRRAQIRREIWQLQADVRYLNTIRNNLVQQKQNLNQSITKWKQNKNVYTNQEITKEVVITNVFEGNAATSIKTQNENHISNMDCKVVETNGIVNQLQTQITRVDTRVNSLRTRIEALYSQL